MERTLSVGLAINPECKCAKRVLFIVGTLQTGGIERSVMDWCLYLKEKKMWEPIVVCLLKRNGPFLQVLIDHGITVEECKLDGRWFSFRLSKLIKRLKPDVVHSQVAFSMPWQVIGMVLAGTKKVIFTQQNEYQNWNPLAARLRLKFYFLVFFRFISSYTCVSEKVRTSLSLLSGRSHDDFVIIPNGVNTDLFFPDPAERDLQRRELKLSPDDFVVGMVGRFSPQKGHRYLIQAARSLKDRRINCRILLIGIGELESEIRQMVRQNGLDDFVLFYGQALKVNKVLQALDCFVLPSVWEGMPLALLEAMASGVPVIGTDVAGTREVIRDNFNGLLIPAKDSNAIAVAISLLIDEPGFRKKLAFEALTYIRDNYSVSANMSAYLKLYER